MKVKEIMKKSIIKIFSDTTIVQAAKLMDKEDVGCVLIEEDDKLIGLVTEGDILRRIVAKGKNPDKVIVKDIMSSPLITANQGISVVEANNLMDKHGIRRLMVTYDDKVVGLVTIRDINRNVAYTLGKRVLSNYQTEHHRPSYGKPED